jgi:hypothetical protein
MHAQHDTERFINWSTPQPPIYTDMHKNVYTYMRIYIYMYISIYIWPRANLGGRPQHIDPGMTSTVDNGYDNKV